MDGAFFLKCFCVFLLIGLTAAKIDVNKLNKTALHRPIFDKKFANAAQVFADDFCDNYEDGDAWPHPDSCQQFFMCWGGDLLELICDDGDLFDPVDLVCDDADYVDCLDEPWPPGPDPDPECPPPGSTEIVFLPSIYCDEFYICINGQPILLQCRPGQHWNIEKGKFFLIRISENFNFS